MLSSDKFSAWLGIELLEVNQGNCVVGMTVREEMLNGFGIAHGGVVFSLADTALAIASNSYNRLSVALEASISYPVKVNNGDQLVAKATELSLTNRTGMYQVHVLNQLGKLVGIFKGTVYRTEKTLMG